MSRFHIALVTTSVKLAFTLCISITYMYMYINQQGQYMYTDLPTTITSVLHVLNCTLHVGCKYCIFVPPLPSLPLSSKPLSLFLQLEGVNGTMIANQYVRDDPSDTNAPIRTIITLDNGGNWELVRRREGGREGGRVEKMV